MADISPEELEKKVDQFTEWVNSQPHLPKDLDRKVLRRFVHSCYFDLDRAKNALETFCSFRAASPDLVNNRDPDSPQLQKAMKIVNLGQLKISGNRKLWIWQLNDPGLESFDYLQDARLFFMTTDAWLLEDEDLVETDLVLMDVKDITLKFITKINVSVARKLSKYQEEAMPIRLKQIHVVNAPPFIDKIFGIMKPFLKQEIVDMVHFHSPKSETLYKYIDKQELPQDFGGYLPKMVEHNRNVMQITMKHKTKLSSNDLWKAIDKKNKTKVDASSEVGTFRTLSID